MNCVRCGEKIQEGADSCPSCGLKIKTPLKPGALLPPEKPPATPSSLKKEYSPEHEEAMDYIAPGEVRLPEPSGIKTTPGKEKRELPVAIIAILIGGLVIVTIAAAIYFLALKQTGLSEPELAVHAYFDAISSGNVENVKSCFVPESQPNDAKLASTLSVISRSNVKMEPKTKLVSENKSEARVKIVDIKLSASAGGREFSFELSKFGNLLENAIVHLRKQGGRWLIVRTD